MLRFFINSRLFDRSGTLFRLLANTWSLRLDIFILWPIRFGRLLGSNIIKITSKSWFHLILASDHVGRLEALIAFLCSIFKCFVNGFGAELFFQDIAQTNFTVWNFWVSSEQFFYQGNLQFDWVHKRAQILGKIPQNDSTASNFTNYLQNRLRVDETVSGVIYITRNLQRQNSSISLIFGSYKLRRRDQFVRLVDPVILPDVQRV